MPVGTVLTFLSMGDSIDDVLRNWPELSRESVEEAIRLAAELVHERYPGKIKAKLRAWEKWRVSVLRISSTGKSAMNLSMP